MKTPVCELSKGGRASGVYMVILQFIYLMLHKILEHEYTIVAIASLVSIYSGCCLGFFSPILIIFSTFVSSLSVHFPREVCLGTLRSLPV